MEKRKQIQICDLLDYFKRIQNQFGINFGNFFVPVLSCIDIQNFRTNLHTKFEEQDFTLVV